MGMTTNPAAVVAVGGGKCTLHGLRKNRYVGIVCCILTMANVWNLSRIFQRNTCMGQNSWDEYFLRVATEIGANSKCLSRQIGAILVLDKSIISTGYNGPARGVPHCTTRRDIPGLEVVSQDLELRYCPRQLLGFGSGKGLHLCIAVHAEVNTITNAARNGIAVKGSILYLSGGILPCVNCMSAIVNAGIVEVIVADLTYYDEASKFIIKHSNVVIRDYKGGTL